MASRMVLRGTALLVAAATLLLGTAAATGAVAPDAAPAAPAAPPAAAPAGHSPRGRRGAMDAAARPNP